MRSLFIDSDLSFDPPDAGLYEKLSNQILKAPPWKDYIDSADLSTIIWRAAYREASRYPRGFSGKLAELDDGKAAEQLIGVISAELQEIPSTVDIFIPVNGLVQLQQAEIKLTDRIALVDSVHSKDLAHYLETAKPSNGLFQLLGAGKLSAANPPSRFIKIQTTGFASDGSDSQVVREALSETKQIVFVGLATGAFSLAYSSQRWDMRSNAERLPGLVVQYRDGESTVHGISLPYDLNHFLQRIQFKDPLQVFDYQPGKGLLTSGMRPATDGKDVSEAVATLLDTASKFVSLKSPDALAIRAAMEWYIDSASTSNESISFLQRCIGLEALLGVDGGRRDVTERLADRYAYLLGKTESERGKMRHAFREMYSHRSDVVHGRASRLSAGHRRASYDSADMLLRCTWAEMQNVLKATKEPS